MGFVDYLIGFLIAALCGVIPLFFGLITKQKVLGIVGISVTALSGLLFVLLEKSAFTAIGVAAVFAIFAFASYKKKSQPSHNEEEED